MKITGVVRTNKGEPLSGARVTWTVDGLTGNAASDHSGRFLFHDPKTQHRDTVVQLRAEHSGFKPQQIEEKLGPSGDLEIDFELHREEVPGIALQLESATITAIPGQAVRLRAEVTNLAHVDEEVSLTLGGVPTPWVASPVLLVHLAPVASRVAEFELKVPRSPDSRAGDYPITIQATSQGRSGEVHHASAQLTIAQFWEQTAELNPPRASGRSRAQYMIVLRNLGNTPAAYGLTVISTEPELTYAFDHNHVPLHVGESAGVRLTLTAPRRWIGRSQKHIFTARSQRIVADSSRAHNEFDRAEEISATFIHNAVLTPTALALLLVGTISSVLMAHWWPLILTAVGLFLAVKPYRPRLKGI